MALSSLFKSPVELSVLANASKQKASIYAIDGKYCLVGCDFRLEVGSLISMENSSVLVLGEVAGEIQYLSRDSSYLHSVSVDHVLRLTGSGRSMAGESGCPAPQESGEER